MGAEKGSERFGLPHDGDAATVARCPDLFDPSAIGLFTTSSTAVITAPGSSSTREITPRDRHVSVEGGDAPGPLTIHGSDRAPASSTHQTPICNLHGGLDSHTEPAYTNSSRSSFLMFVDRAARRSVSGGRQPLPAIRQAWTSRQVAGQSANALRSP